MASKNVEYLREHGPSTYEELPSGKVSASDRRNGIWKFKLEGTTTNGGSSDSTGGHINLVYYLKDEHSKEAVLRAFLDANPRLVETKTRKGLRGMLRQQGRQWYDVIDEVFPVNEEANDA